MIRLSQLLLEYTGDTFNAPQPDLDTYGTHDPDPHKKEKIEEISALLEKNTPTSPDKWAKAKAAAKSKFKVYPSAYANHNLLAYNTGSKLWKT